MPVVLYSYFRSSCSWRVRIALNFLKVPHVIRPVNLLKNEQVSVEYQSLNPLGTVPALQTENGQILWQSLAIIDWLDNQGKLLPEDPMDRARCWQISNTICSEIQPLQNLFVGKMVAELVGGGSVGEAQKLIWSKHHNLTKLKIIENHLVDVESKFCIGHSLSLADLCLVPQLYSAGRFGIDIFTEFPKLMKIAENLQTLPDFQLAHPHAQPDCPPEVALLGTKF